MNISSNAKFVLQVVLSLLTFGLTWAVDNQAAIVTAIAIVVVWALNTAMKRLGISLGRGYVTGVLYVISFVLVVLFNPVALPNLPALPQDPALLVGVLAAYVQMLIVR